jgi:hypothetical protein
MNFLCFQGFSHSFDRVNLSVELRESGFSSPPALTLEWITMKNIYACPHCQTVLNPSVKILLVVQYKKKKGMILLSPQPGNFHFICDSKLQKALTPGALVNFSCPVCSSDLTSAQDKKFVELSLLSPGRESRRVEFSREFGKQATLIIDGNEVAAFGRDAEESSGKNFFGA